jgi:hybrid cluster-associated redox disulfide protein
MITPNLCMAEIMERWPGTISLFLEHRMACVGCSLSAYDTLEEALKVYNLPQEEVLRSLNKQVAEAHQHESKRS